MHWIPVYRYLHDHSSFRGVEFVLYGFLEQGVGGSTGCILHQIVVWSEHGGEWAQCMVETSHFSSSSFH